MKVEESIKIISDGIKTQVIIGGVEMQGVRKIIFEQDIDCVPTIQLDMFVVPTHHYKKSEETVELQIKFQKVLIDELKKKNERYYERIMQYLELIHDLQKTIDHLLKRGEQ